MEEEKVLRRATVCFPIKDNKVLLGMKTKKIGKGCWNGYGGGIEPEESELEAAIRELKEETKNICARATDLELVAIVDYYNTKSDGVTFECRVFFYKVKQWKGEAEETEEMIKPTWFDIDQLPLALSGQKIMAKVYHGPYQKSILRKVKIKKVDSFPEH